MADLETSVLIRILDAFTAPLKKLEDGLGNAEEQADKLRKKMALAADLNQAAEASGRFAMALLGPMKGAVDEFVTFEQAMSRVQALTGTAKGSPQLEALRMQAKELGAVTAYSSEEAAEAMQAYAQAGFDTAQILAVVPQTMSAAAANATSLADTATIVGGTLNAMGIDVSETSRVVDVLTKAGAESNASLSDLGHALSIVGPQSRQTGTSLELTAAMLGRLRDANIDASSAGTGLRAVMQRIIKPSNEAEKAFKALGINGKELAKLQTQVATGKIDQVLKRIGEAGKTLPDAKRLAAMGEIFGLEASSAANVLISASMDASPKGLEAFRQSLHRLDDDTNRMAKVMQDNLGGALERAGGAISGLKVQLGEVLAPTVDTLANRVGGAADAVTGLAQEYPNATRASLELIANLGLTALALKGVLTAHATYLAGTAALTKAYGVMSGSLLGRIGLVAAAGAAGYAVGTWANETFGLADKISSLLGRSGPERDETRGIQADEDREYTGGWRLSGKTGEVLKMGTGTAPAAVRRAQAAGAKSLEEINAYIKAHPAAAPAGGEAAPAAPAGGEAAPAAPDAAALAALASAAPQGDVAGSSANTDRVVGALDRVDKKLGDLVDHMRRGQRVPAPMGTY